MKKPIVILNIYPRDMNIYGDYGNVLCLKRRLEWYGYEPKVIEYNQGDKFPDDVDIVVGGGGQDSGQEQIKNDLKKISSRLIKLAESGTPMFVVCGLYQLFGKSFKTAEGKIIPGISLLDITTIGKPERLIGNVISKSEEFGDIIGYENHSGQTFLGKNVTALGKIRLGAGNNMGDTSEGARYKNVIGTYLHGSLLPKNPKIADFLIRQSAILRYGYFAPTTSPDDTLALKARKFAIKRPR